MANYEYKMGDHVKLSASGETGKIIGRAEYDHTENNYLIRYMAGDGRQVEQWWAETALE